MEFPGPDSERESVGFEQSAFVNAVVHFMCNGAPRLGGEGDKDPHSAISVGWEAPQNQL